MSLSSVEAQAVLRSGGSLRLSRGYSSVELQACAIAAKMGGARLTIVGRGLTSMEMTAIATAGKGHVEFDLTV